MVITLFPAQVKQPLESQVKQVKSQFLQVLETGSLYIPAAHVHNGAFYLPRPQLIQLFADPSQLSHQNEQAVHIVILTVSKY